MNSESLIKVAYADDHNLVRKGIISFMKQLGGIDVIIQATNGRELLRELVIANELPDIVIVDINMPEMDGFETVAAVKERWPDIKILVLTVFENEMYIIRMLQLGASGYLLKTCNPEEIKRALVSIKASGYYYSNQVSSQLINKVKNHRVTVPHFTEREVELLKYCSTDLSYNQIAEKLQTTKRAIDSCRDRLFEKLEVKTRTALAISAIQYGIKL